MRVERSALNAPAAAIPWTFYERLRRNCNRGRIKLFFAGFRVSRWRL